MSKVFVVGLGGPSGTGKSKVAKAVAARLDAHILSMEVYSAPMNHLPLPERSRQNYDAPNAIDVQLLEQNLRDLVAGQAIEAPIYDFAEHMRLSRRENVRPKTLLIVEGILALHLDQLRPYYDLAIYLEAPDKVCFHRREVRDITERQRSLEMIRWQYENTVLPAARAYAIPSKRHADVVVNTEADFETVQNRVYDAIESKRALAATP